MRRTTLWPVALLTALLVGGAVAPSARAERANAVPDHCFVAPRIGLGYTTTDVVLLEGTDVETLVSSQGLGCPGGVSTTIRRPDGTTLTVELPTQFESPPYVGYYGPIRFPVGGPLGTWTFTSITVEGETRPVSRTFRVDRATAVAIEPVAPVTAPAAQTVRGLVTTWNSVGALVPVSRGLPVEVRTKAGTRIGSSATDASGRFTIVTRLVHDNLVAAYAAGDPARNLAPSGSTSTPVVVRAVLSSLTASTTGVVNRWWRVDGRSAPGGLFTMLLVWRGSFWSGPSFGSSNADGSFTRWWKPTAPGTYRLRLDLSGSFNTGLPIERELSVVVRSLQTVPTYLDGRVGPTAGGVVRRMTKMSTFGHLRVRRSNGTIGPFAGQVVLIQARPRGSAEWNIVQTAVTSSTGYLYANWSMIFDADTEVRLAYTSPYETIRSTSLGLGVVDVVP